MATLIPTAAATTATIAVAPATWPVTPVLRIELRTITVTGTNKAEVKGLESNRTIPALCPDTAVTPSATVMQMHITVMYMHITVAAARMLHERAIKLSDELLMTAQVAPQHALLAVLIQTVEVPLPLRSVELYSAQNPMPGNRAILYKPLARNIHRSP
jgi:hypothetical protein